MPGRAGKKNAQNAPGVAKRDGCASIGPSPWPAQMAQASSVSAAAGKKTP